MGRGGGFFYLGSDGLENAGEVLRHVVVPEADYAPALRLQRAGAGGVPTGVGGVLAAVDLDDELSARNGKVPDVTPDGVLSADFHRERHFPQRPPENAFDLCGVPAKFSGAACSRLDHALDLTTHLPLTPSPLKGGGGTKAARVGAFLVRTMVRWKGGGGGGQHRGMQSETAKRKTAAPYRRSSVKRLPSTLREAVDQAIAEGATIDEITALIRERGGTCSRSAVGRYAKDRRDLICRQEETDREIAVWARELGERAHGHTGLFLIEILRTFMVATLANLGRREEPLSPEELARLALALSRIERGDRHRLQKEQAAAKAAHAAPGAGRPAHPPAGRKKKGLSPETVALIQEAVEGRPRRAPVTSVPVDPWNPDTSPVSPGIPPNPAKKCVGNEARAGPRA